MAVRTPLQVVVSRDSGDRRTDAYVDTLRVAFEGTAAAAGSPSAYLDDAVDLGIRVLEPAEDVSDAEIRSLTNGAERSVLVVVGPGSARNEALRDRVDPDCVVSVEAPPEIRDDGIQGDRGLAEERDFAPVVAALQAMESARRALAAESARVGLADSTLKLFISHAKTDGLAMARSLIGVLRQLSEAAGGMAGFEYFYDAEHIAPGSLWRKVLDAEMGRSVLIALRTEAYESRYWCRREFLLAESNAMPIVVVDLRADQYHDSALLPFDAVPTVRVHDGNLIRVVLHAIGAHLRALRVQSQAPQATVLPHRPTLYSLTSAAGTGGLIAYPGPRVPHAYHDALEPILSSGPSPARLRTFDELQ